MNSSAHRTAGLLRLVYCNASLRRLLGALAASALGDWLYNLALLAFVYDRTHSVEWTAATTAARVLPMVVLGPLGGVLADRYDRRRLMIASDVVRAALMAGLAVVAVAGLPVLIAPVLAALCTALSVVYPPAVAATLPRLVSGGELAAANSARSMIQSASIIVGPAGGAVLLAFGSPAVAFLLNAVTFVVSAVALMGLPAGALFAPPRPRDGLRGGLAGVLEELRGGVVALRDNHAVARLVGADVVCSVLYGAQTVLLLMLGRRLGFGDGGLGYLLAGLGVGGLGGAALAARLSPIRHNRHTIGAVLAGVAVTSALFGVVPDLAVAVLLAVAVGAGSVLVEVVADTALARSLDDAVLARAYGLVFPASIGGIAVGSLVAAPLVALFGLTWALAAVGGIAAGYAAVMCLPVPVRRGHPDILAPVGADIP